MRDLLAEAARAGSFHLLRRALFRLDDLLAAMPPLEPFQVEPLKLHDEVDVDVGMDSSCG